LRNLTAKFGDSSSHSHLGTSVVKLKDLALFL